MQQFTVPQFIDVEDKIIGPVTSRQFVIMLGSFILMAIFYKIFDFSLFLLTGGLVFMFSMVFSFVKINGRPFHFFTLNLVQTFKRPNLRIWLNGLKFELDTGKTEVGLSRESQLIEDKAYARASSRLDELALIVDTQGAYKGERKN